MYTQKYEQIYNSVPKNNWDRWHNTIGIFGAGCNWELDKYTHNEIAKKLAETLKLQKDKPIFRDDKWFWSITVPNSDMSIAVLHDTIFNRTQKKLQNTKIVLSEYTGNCVEILRNPKDIKIEDAYCVVLSNSVTYVSFWRVFTFEEMVDKIIYWIARFQGIISQK